MIRIAAVTDFASVQQGYLTRAQAASLGVDDVTLHREVAKGMLVPVARGVYRVAGAPEHPHEGIWAAWLALDPGLPAYGRLADPQELVFGRSALDVYGIGDLPEHVHEFAVRRPRRTRLAGVALRHRRWEPGDWSVVEHMAVARPEWVIVEGICDGEDGDHMAAALADARHRGLIDAEYLLRRLDSLGRVRSRGVVAVVT